MRKIDNIIDTAIEFVNSREFSYDIAKAVGATNFAIQYQTVKIDLGRQVGKTWYIARTATPKDLIISAKPSTMRTMKERVYAFNVHQIDICNASYVKDVPVHIYDRIYIDDASFVSKQHLQDIYDKFAGNCNLFVLIG